MRATTIALMALAATCWVGCGDDGGTSGSGDPTGTGGDGAAGGTGGTGGTGGGAGVCGDGVVDAGEDCDDSGESASCNADCTAASCGDGVTNATAGEGCDDSGESATCNADCTAASCGDSVLNTTAGETCDDGGESATCDNDCTAVSCGDGVSNVTAGEDCDDAGESANCDADCTTALCGDSQINNTAGETCDDGGRSGTCDNDCTAVSCGDGVTNVTAGEQCDDAGESTTCDADCTNALCGDGLTNATAGETCDDSGESTTCDTDCTAAACGDGLTNATAGETCDDAGESATCDTDCTAATCGDGLTNATAGEQCDDAGESSTCDTDCTAAICGDGVPNSTAGEECDDGNLTPGDGCDASCILELTCQPAILSSGFSGTAGWTGVMFDIESLSGAFISGFDIDLDPGTHTVEVYFRSGTHLGFETNAAAWTLIGSNTVVSNGLGVPTPIPFAIDVSIPQGGTYGFYVTTTANGGLSNGLSYHFDTAAGAVADSDDHIALRAGSGMDYPFQSAGFSGRHPHINIHYQARSETTFVGGNNQNGVMFNLATSGGNEYVRGFAANLPAGTHDVEVYAKVGTYVGSEGTAGDWTLIGSANGVVSNGPGVPTLLPIPVNLSIPNLQTFGFYLTTTSTLLNYTDGPTSGTLSESWGDLDFFVGIGKAYPFGASFQNRIWNGVIEHYQVTPLTTTNAGGNGNAGSMFDIVAQNDVKISGFRQHVSSAGTFELYMTEGGITGKLTNAAAWTLVGSVAVTGTGVGQPLLIPVDIDVASGDTVGFYITGTATGSVNYTDGNGTGTVEASDGNLQILEGVGKTYPFGTTNQNRIWNGTVLYGRCN